MPSNTRRTKRRFSLIVLEYLIPAVTLCERRMLTQIEIDEFVGKYIYWDKWRSWPLVENRRANAKGSWMLRKIVDVLNVGRYAKQKIPSNLRFTKATLLLWEDGWTKSTLAVIPRSFGKGCLLRSLSSSTNKWPDKLLDVWEKKSNLGKFRRREASKVVVQFFQPTNLKTRVSLALASTRRWLNQLHLLDVDYAVRYFFDGAKVS